MKPGYAAHRKLSHPFHSAIKQQVSLLQSLADHFPEGTIFKHAFLTFLRGFQSRTHCNNYTLAVGAATFLATSRLALCDQGPTRYDRSLIGPMSITPWTEYLIDQITI